MANLIVDFPHQRNRNRRLVVQFVDTTDINIVERHEDNETNNVARDELWYTKAEYYSMRRAVQEDALKVRTKALTRGDFDYSGNDNPDDNSTEESSVCCIGIEHLLTRECTLKVKACRLRCIRAVLEEQARQGSEMDIALASFDQTGTAENRARALARLHRDASERS